MTWVLKLGGSLYGSTQLRTALVHVARRGAGRVVLVPGGGPFADSVRAAQQHHGLGDHHAHRMALRGMEQYGLMLAAMQPRLQPVGDLETMRRALAAGRVPVWLPVPLAESWALPACDWTLTSDSLALLLTAALGARHLLLIKAAPMQRVAGRLPPAPVDAAFMPLLAAQPAELRVAWSHPAALERLGESLRRQCLPGLPVVPAGAG